jgi:hypothetical protein
MAELRGQRGGTMAVVSKAGRASEEEHDMARCTAMSVGSRFISRTIARMRRRGDVWAAMHAVERPCGYPEAAR